MWVKMTAGETIDVAPIPNKRKESSRGGGIAVAVMMAFGNECDFLCGVNRIVGEKWQ